MPLSQTIGAAELAVGKAQYRALTGIVRRLTGVRRASAVIDGVHVPYFLRRGGGWLDRIPSRAGRNGSGANDPIVLVHGFGGDKEGWLLMASMLGRRRGLVIPDLPGFGAAGAIPKRSASAAAQARVLAGLLDELGIGRAHFVGNSMGGGISLRFAADYPERAASITLMCSVGPIVEKSELGLALDRGENPLITDSPDDLDRLLSLVAEKKPPSSRAMRKYLGTDRFARREALFALFDGWNAPVAGEGVPTELAKIRTHALVVHGAKDRVIHPSTGKALAEQLPNARLEILEGIGHVPMMEAPKLVAQIVDRFVGSVG